jgi:heme/copper-type cytochrome/quinol oxidase subunit 3
MFCTNCGKEVADNAFACPACGCLLHNEQTVKRKESQTDKEKREKLIHVFLLVSFGCFCGCLFFFLNALLSPYVEINSIGSRVYANISYDSSLAGPSLVCYFPFLGFAITAFVMALRQQENKTLKTLCILNFMLAVLFLPITITLVNMA